MKTALIISLNFNPGHVSHMVASYKQCEEIGYKASYFVDPAFADYLPEDGNILKNGIDACPISDLAIFLFPSQKNLPLIWKLKRKGIKVIYIFYEPLSPMKDYRKVGFSFKYLAKLWVINRISSLTVKRSDIVLLPSKKAVSFYEKNPSYSNPNYHYLPLMYDDERGECHATMLREYFSYIGTVAADHSFNEYLKFVEWAVGENWLPSMKFLVATKSTFNVPEVLKDSERVVIKQGSPLSNTEINKCYAQSFCVWNAYARTTQSGVLAKSFMFGTSALVLKKNCNEFARDGIEIKAIEDNSNTQAIADAIDEILKEFREFSANCRKRFLTSFYYKNYNECLKKLIDS